jgi:sugar (pentulose or hexulose) kinase
MADGKDLVIGLDSSTTATKAIAWTTDGVIAGEGRSPIPLLNPAHDRYEQNSDDWWHSACAALRELLQRVDPGRIAALAISNQRETFVPLASDGRPVRPAIVWLDQRCRDEVDWLASRVGDQRIHEITGKPPDVAPVAYRLGWMARHEPDLLQRTAVIADVHAYLAWRLTGSFRTSWASADPLGLFDMGRRAWSDEVLDALGLSATQLPELARPGTVIGTVGAAAAAATSLRTDTPVVAGGGDGQAAGLGVNALGSGRAYLNLGTAVVAGIYSRTYQVGRAWRTMGSCTGEGVYLETSLRSGTFLIDWFANTLCPAAADRRTTLQALEAEASAVPIGSRGLIALPYWGAVMTPYWDPQARGCWIGLSGSHRRADMYRSLLEGIALEQALVTEMIESATGTPVTAFAAIGGGAASDLWCRILADATGRPIVRPATVEASSLGAAMCAAAGAGIYPQVADAAAGMCDRAPRSTEPSADNSRHYAALLGTYREIYPRLRETFAALSSRTEG